MSISLRKWFNDLPWMQQGVLLGSIRNCDGHRSEGPHKILIRGIRAACIKAARSTGSFNSRRPGHATIKNCAEQFTDCHFDHMPIHFVTHLMQAAEVIAYKHPDPNVRNTWWYVYQTIVSALHLNPETIVEFEKRLSDDPEQVSREDECDDFCYKYGNYEENVGTKNERDPNLCSRCDMLRPLIAGVCATCARLVES